MDSTEYQQLQMFLSTIVSNPQYVPLYMPPHPPPPSFMLPRYIIITDASLVESFEPLAEWLTDKGVPTEIVTTQYIYSHYSPEYPDHPTGPPGGSYKDENGNEIYVPGEDIYEGENAGRIRNFLKDRYASSIGLRYVLLGGDDALVPVRYCSPDPYNSIEAMSTIYGQWCPADLYFADLSGDWNCGWHSLSDQTPDDYWGVVYSAHDYCNDSPDVWPELKIGRVLVRTPQEVTNWVNKRLCYEWYASRDRPDFDNLTTALWIYSTEIVDWENYHGNWYVPGLFPGYLTREDNKDAFSDDVLHSLSEGPGFVNINCHGSPVNFNPYGGRHIEPYRSDAPSQTCAGLNWLTNDSLYNIIYATSCEVAWFDTGAYGRIHNMVTDNTIADAFTDNYSSSSDPDWSGRGPIGATAFLGNTRDGLEGSAERLQYHFWDSFWNWRISRYRPSIAEAASKIALYASRNYPSPIWYTRYVHNFFGCPEMEAWTEAPKEMIVNLPHDPTIPPGGGWVNLTVTVWDAETGNPVYRARVCLNKPGDVYASTLTNWLGCANFSIYIHSSGWMRVTVTRQHTMSPQYLPYRDSCYVYYSTVGKQEPSINPSLPKKLTLNLLSSNPLTHPLNICYGVPKKGMVKLVIYDPLGRRVKTIADGVLSPNWYRIRLDPKKEGLACGIYWLVLEQDQRSIKKKLVILR